MTVSVIDRKKNGRVLEKMTIPMKI